MKKIINYASGTILLVFGILSLFLSTSVIFDLFGIREMEGNYVPLIVWANFIVSFLYIAAAYGYFMEKKWVVTLLGLASALFIVAFIYLIFHINEGGIYEKKTVGAMVFRTFMTLTFTFIPYFTFKKKK
ncbi:MAG TPA: hypothetical protein VFD77_05620 [Brumimicrobium sp.]|nr:hypothetical protein [Brumimicrobium sp.]